MVVIVKVSGYRLAEVIRVPAHAGGLEQVHAHAQITALLAPNPAAPADLTESEPLDAIYELLIALHQVSTEVQATTLAERAIANADPVDLDSTSALLVTMHAVERAQLARDPLPSSLA